MSGVHSIPSGKTYPMQCMHCRTKVKSNVTGWSADKKGKLSIHGICPVCKTNTRQYIGADKLKNLFDVSVRGGAEDDMMSFDDDSAIMDAAAPSYFGSARRKSRSRKSSSRKSVSKPKSRKSRKSGSGKSCKTGSRKSRKSGSRKSGKGSSRHKRR